MQDNTKSQILRTHLIGQTNGLLLHTIAARTLFVVLTIHWYWYLTSPETLEQRLSVFSLLYRGSLTVIVFSLGLWLSTTTFGSKHRIVVSILLMPTLLGSAMLANTYSVAYMVVVIGITLWSYWIVIKRRRQAA